MKRFRITKISLIAIAVASFTLFSCSNDDKVEEDPVVIVEEPIYLDCGDFEENRVLVNNPNAPIDYIVDCAIALRETTLTIEPGVVIAFTENGSLEVEGFYNTAAIIAKGTADNPIVFKGTKEEKGHWKGIRISNDNDINEFDYVIIRDAGKQKWRQGETQGGLSLGRDSQGIGRVKLTNSKLINNRGYGLDCSNYSLSTTYETDYTLLNNIMKENDFPARATMYNMQYLDPSNDFHGNTTDEIHIISGGNGTLTTTKDATWYNHNMPYIFSPGIVGLSCIITIQPGTVMKFANASSLIVDRRWGTAGIIAKGTPSEPIVFTAIEPIQRYWHGITINSPYPGNEISHAIIEYTGMLNREETHNLTLAVGSGGTTYLNIHDVTFQNSNTGVCAIWLQCNSIWSSWADISNITLAPGHCLLRDDNVDCQ